MTKGGAQNKEETGEGAERVQAMQPVMVKVWELIHVSRLRSQLQQTDVWKLTGKGEWGAPSESGGVQTVSPGRTLWLDSRELAPRWLQVRELCIMGCFLLEAMSEVKNWGMGFI